MKTAILGHLSPFAKLIFFLMLLLTGLIVALGIGILLANPIYHINLLTDMKLLSDFSNPATVSLMKFLQIVQSIGLFIVPALLAGYFFERRPLGYAGLNKIPGAMIFLLVLLLMFVTLPFINWLVSINEMMKLPSFLQGIEQWMKDSEDQATQLTVAFLDVRTTGGFLVNMFAIAILPAVGEELLFRGVLQRLFGEWFRNIHVAIFFTAFIFGVIHMQFYGLLPRMMLGVIFGYLYYWSGSLWAPIFAHFLNNGAVVMASFLSNLKIISSDYESFGNTSNLFLFFGSVLFSGLIIWLICKRRKPVEPLTAENSRNPDNL